MLVSYSVWKVFQKFSELQTDRHEKSSGKLPGRHVLTAIIAGKCRHLLYVTDVITKVRYLVNTGAEVDVLPTNSNDRLHKAVLNLQVENRKLVSSYGKRYVYFNVSLCKPFHWIFVVAEVSMPQST